MAKKRREKDASDIKLKQPDRSGPTEQTLLQIVESKKLFQQAEERRAALAKKQKKEDGDEEEDGPSLPPRVERIMESLLWTISLGMLHFTLDVLVQHQYAIDINWWTVISRAFQAFLGNICPSFSFSGSHGSYPNPPFWARGQVTNV